jgi:MoaA/NifB/PqqE/SkfB family radical SAM enzyme
MFNQDNSCSPQNRPVLCEKDISQLLDHSLLSFYKDAIAVMLLKPDMWITTARLFINQFISAHRRRKWRRRNVHVPPFLILSITDKCNLRCAGCFDRELHAGKDGRITYARLYKLLFEAQDLGVSTIMISGGEPLIRRDIFDITERLPSMAFALFTNGTMLGADVIQLLQQRKNVVPVLSMEGNRRETDGRRGDGVFARIESAMSDLRTASIFFGCSITVTRDNFGIATDPQWVERLLGKGCRLFVFVEYIPVTKDSGDLALTQKQREELIDATAKLRRKKKALFVAFPGDEDQFGGCLAAGRGFVHISSSGDIEPCPFSPYSDSSIREKSLMEALMSPLLAKIRENHENLNETKGGCALWKEREWVAEKLRE